MRQDVLMSPASFGPDALRALVDTLRSRIETVVVGKPKAVNATIATFLAGGHLLIEDVPGVGKTTLALSLARCLDLSASRIQFTADLMPTDVTGLSIYDQSTREFQFHPGPVFAGIVIADEINRATPRTQSALLEAMGEGHVSVEGDTRPLPDPFMVVATQNPLDMEGMLLARAGADPVDALVPVAVADDVIRARRAVAGLHVAPAVAAYVVALVSATRADPNLALGASPRAGLHLLAMARAGAAMAGRTYVSPDDVALAAPGVLTHRLVPAGRQPSDAAASEVAARALARHIASTPVPRG